MELTSTMHDPNDFDDPVDQPHDGCATMRVDDQAACCDDCKNRLQGTKEVPCSPCAMDVPNTDSMTL